MKPSPLAESKNCVHPDRSPAFFLSRRTPAGAFEFRGAGVPPAPLSSNLYYAVAFEFGFAFEFVAAACFIDGRS
jgi:hypothetical protein